MPSATTSATTTRSPSGSLAAGSAPRRWCRQSAASPSLCRPGRSAPAGPGSGASPAPASVSLHIPWDEPDDVPALRALAAELGLGFDAVNSNTFQDQPGQPLSYKLGSFSHADAAVRRQAVEHHRHVIEVGQALGADAITVWLADGSNYPGQMSLRQSFDRVLDCLRDVYATVVQDWGSSLLLAQTLGERAQCLVDLGHHLPNTNIELVVARLLGAGKLGGFHFNDSKYGDDDLTAGSIKPYGLFLIFHELVLAERERLV